MQTLHELRANFIKSTGFNAETMDSPHGRLLRAQWVEKILHNQIELKFMHYGILSHVNDRSYLVFRDREDNVIPLLPEDVSAISEAQKKPAHVANRNVVEAEAALRNLRQWRQSKSWQRTMAA